MKQFLQYLAISLAVGGCGNDVSVEPDTTLSPLPGSDVTAQQTSQLRTCYTLGASQYCAGLYLSLEYIPPEVGEFPYLGYLLGASIGEWDPALTILPTAIGFYAKHKPDYVVSPFTSAGGWVGISPPSSWTVNQHSRHIAHPRLGGYSLFAWSAVGGPLPEWTWAALEGLADDLTVWRQDEPFPEDFLWVWRGESEDGSIVIDCFQDPSGGEDCLTKRRP